MVEPRFQPNDSIIIGDVEARTSIWGDDAPIFFGGRSSKVSKILGGADMKTWMSGLQASRLSGRNQYSLMKLALLGRLRFRADRGQAIQFHREDVERLVGVE